MPMVGGKKYSYTPAGRAAAKKAKQQQRNRRIRRSAKRGNQHTKQGEMGMKLIRCVVLACLVGFGGLAYAGTYDNGTATTTVEYVAPLYNENNTPLDDLSYLTLYWGGSPGSYSGSQDVIVTTPGAVGSTTLNIPWDVQIPSGQFSLYIVGTATDFNGNESGYSNELKIDFIKEDLIAPNPPSLNSLDIVITTPKGDVYQMAKVSKSEKERKKRRTK